MSKQSASVQCCSSFAMPSFTASGASSCFTGLLALLSAHGAEGAEQGSCSEVAVYKSKQIDDNWAATYLKIFLGIACFIFVAGIWLGYKAGKPTKKKSKEIGIQTEVVERMSVAVAELTIESIKDRLKVRDLRTTGLKGELAVRLAAHSRW